MRQTSLTLGSQEARIQTNEYGTQILGASDVVLGSYGTDRHDELVEKYQAEGWKLGESRDIRPAEAGTASPDKDDEGDGSGEQDLGISS